HSGSGKQPVRHCWGPSPCLGNAVGAASGAGSWNSANWGRQATRKTMTNLTDRKQKRADRRLVATAAIATLAYAALAVSAALVITKAGAATTLDSTSSRETAPIYRLHKATIDGHQIYGDDISPDCAHTDSSAAADANGGSVANDTYAGSYTNAFGAASGKSARNGTVAPCR